MAVIEGISIMLTRLTAPPPAPPVMAMAGGPETASGSGNASEAASGDGDGNARGQESGSIWGNVFGGGRKAEEETGGAPAMPDFGAATTELK